MHYPEPTNKDLRSFGLILGSGIVILFGLFFPWLADRPFPLWPWIFLAISGGIGLTIPVVLKPLYALWMRLGHVLGWINTRIILGIVFFVFLFPLGFVMRLFGWDAMARKIDASTTSYRVESKRAKSEQLEKPY